jgi:acetyl-CoA acetyltransferase family protein
MKEAVIVDAVRTPMGKRKGSLAGMHPVDLAAEPLRALVKRTGIDPLLIDDVLMGCVSQTLEQGMNIGRAAVLAADLPIEIPGLALNRFCGSGQQSVNFAAQAVMSGMQDVVIAAGVEAMTRVPMGSDLPGAVGSHMTERFSDLVPQGISAEMIAEQWNFSREDVDRFAYESQMKAKKAWDENRFKKEIMTVTVKKDDGSTVEFARDEHFRPSTTLEGLAALQPAFVPTGKITAGNSSGIVDGAAAVLVMSLEKAKELKLKPRARIVSMAIVGSEPKIMLTGPIPASQKALKKANLQAKDIDRWEINEAFAPVVLATMHDLQIDRAKVNVWGGAIALGHPLGASGARLIGTLVNQLEQDKLRYGLATMCIGYGMGIATIVERV